MIKLTYNSSGKESLTRSARPSTKKLNGLAMDDLSGRRSNDVIYIIFIIFCRLQHDEDDPLLHAVLPHARLPVRLRPEAVH